MPDLLYEKNVEEHYAVFTMNRPDRLNAMGGSMNEDFSIALHDFNNDRDMWVGIVTGAGRAFSAGADLRQMAERNTQVAEINERFEKGEIDGDALGLALGELDGLCDGDSDGDALGLGLGELVGGALGLALGDVDGLCDGGAGGDALGLVRGELDGDSLGPVLGKRGGAAGAASVWHDAPTGQGASTQWE